jgi:hypothetical protein
MDDLFRKSILKSFSDFLDYHNSCDSFQASRALRANLDDLLYEIDQIAAKAKQEASLDVLSSCEEAYELVDKLLNAFYLLESFALTSGVVGFDFIHWLEVENNLTIFYS